MWHSAAAVSHVGGGGGRTRTPVHRPTAELHFQLNTTQSSHLPLVGDNHALRISWHRVRVSMHVQHTLPPVPARVLIPRLIRAPTVGILHALVHHHALFLLQNTDNITYGESHPVR